jgi:ribosomal protein S18 acetylase RimI-like enzyme
MAQKGEATRRIRKVRHENRSRTESAASNQILVRLCKPADLPAVANLAARLVREHHAMDPNRFFIFGNIEEGYARYLGSEMRKKRSLVLIAADSSGILGYAYGRIEPRDWNALLESCGFVHDLYVDERARRRGVGTRLMDEMIKRLAAQGAPRVDLMTAALNTNAHRLFERLGFRTTMLEMTRECEETTDHTKRDC